MKEKVNTLNYFKVFGFLFYFIVLFAERIQSVIRSYLHISSAVNNIPLNGYMLIITMLAIVGAIVCLNKQIIYMFKCAFSLNKSNYEKINYKTLAIASGIILVGGMVHTYETILWLQFISYAGLIASMLMVTLENNHNKEIRLVLWLSFIMLVCFAMAIPVVYYVSNKTPVINTFLNVYQPIASMLLVISFTMLLVKFYEKNGITSFSICVLVLTLAFDLPIFFLRLPEDMNIFLIAFPVLTVITIIWGLIASKKLNIK